MIHVTKTDRRTNKRRRKVSKATGTLAGQISHIATRKKYRGDVKKLG